MENSYSKSVKGRQGFIKKYESLGQTKSIKVPTILIGHLQEIMIEFNRIKKEKGEKEFNKILGDLIDYLKKI
jgi:hypothetical protein